MFVLILFDFCPQCVRQTASSVDQPLHVTGAYCYCVINIVITTNVSCRLIEEQERLPDFWFREQCSDMWRENKLAVSEFLRSNPDNIVFVHNTTTGCHQLKIAPYA